MRTLTPLTICEECGAHIWANDVFKTFVVPKAPNHLALVFRCAKCGHADRMAAQENEWEAAKDEAANHSTEKGTVIQGALIDLESIEGVDDLIAEWRSLKTPPLREEVMGSCQCDECERRLYG